jgi:hypothetical protein
MSPHKHQVGMDTDRKAQTREGTVVYSDPYQASRVALVISYAEQTTVVSPLTRRHVSRVACSSVICHATLCCDAKRVQNQ